jgi:hypothetical protein
LRGGDKIGWKIKARRDLAAFLPAGFLVLDDVLLIALRTLC